MKSPWFVHEAMRTIPSMRFKSLISRDLTLYEMAEILADKQDGKEAIKVAELIYCDAPRTRAFDYILEKLVKTLSIDEVPETARLIRNERAKTRFLASFSNNLVEEYHLFDQAVEIAQLIPDQDQKWLTIRDIAVLVAKGGNSKKAVMIAQLIHDQDQKWLTIQEIAAIPHRTITSASDECKRLKAQFKAMEKRQAYELEYYQSKKTRRQRKKF